MVGEGRIKKIIIGQSFQSKRESQNMSRSELARQLKVLPQFVSNWERGVCLPPKKCLPTLMKIFNMTPNDIVKLYTSATKIALEEYFSK